MGCFKNHASHRAQVSTEPVGESHGALQNFAA